MLSSDHGSVSVDGGDGLAEGYVKVEGKHKGKQGEEP